MVRPHRTGWPPYKDRPRCSLSLSSLPFSPLPHKGHVRTQQEGDHLKATNRHITRNELLMALRSETSSLRICEKVSLKSPVCGPWLQQPQPTNTRTGVIYKLFLQGDKSQIFSALWVIRKCVNYSRLLLHGESGHR